MDAAPRLAASADYLKPPDEESTVLFGRTVVASEDGNTLAVSLLEKVPGGGDITTGAVMIFERAPSGSFRFTAKLTGPVRIGGLIPRRIPNNFGWAMAFAEVGSVLAIGDPAENGAGAGVDPTYTPAAELYVGAAYLFRRNNATRAWTQTNYIKATRPSVQSEFGRSVALSRDGNFLVVGSPAESGRGEGLNPPITEADAITFQSGAVYTFRRTGGTWAPEDYVKAPHEERGGEFGFAASVSSDGETFAIAAPGESSAGRGVDPPWDTRSSRAGAVHVYRRNAGSWAYDAYLKASNTAPTMPTRPAFERAAEFGTSLTLSADGTVVVAGAPYERGSGAGVDPPSDDAGFRSGATYVYRRGVDDVWRFESYLKAFRAHEHVLFGMSSAVSSDGLAIAVGAIDEWGSGGGINPVADDAAPGAGAIFVFRRADGAWTEGAYLKATRPMQGDHLGYSVALWASGHEAAAGAPFEDGSGAGLNPPDDDSASGTNRGAIYLFQGF